MKHFLYIFATLTILTACNDSSTEPNSETRASFSVVLSSNSSSTPKLNAVDSLSITDMGGTHFTITYAKINLRHIQFDFPSEDSRSKDLDTTEQISIEGPFVVDLMDGSSTPSITEFNIEAGTYKRIDLRLDDVKPTDGIISPSDDMYDNTMILKGIFTYDGITDRNFTFKLKFNEDIRFEEPYGILIQKGGNTQILLNLHVEEWLKNINITKCLDDSEINLDNNGDLIIDDNNGNGDCSDFENTIKHNIKNNYDFN